MGEFIGRIVAVGVLVAAFVGVPDVGRAVGFAGIAVTVAGGKVGDVGCDVAAQPADHSIEKTSNETNRGNLVITPSSARAVLRRACRLLRLPVGLPQRILDIVPVPQVLGRNVVGVHANEIRGSDSERSD